jgi:hypothetical protein
LNSWYDLREQPVAAWWDEDRHVMTVTPMRFDRRWSSPPEQMLRNFATVGRSQGRAAWWRTFVAATAEHATAATLSIELEDPFVPAADRTLDEPRL